MAEISVFNPSLIGYLGGMGRAAQSLGGSLSAMGQTKLDLEKQAQDQKYRDDMYKLNLNADTRATEAVAQAQKDKFDAKNDRIATNVATNAYLMGVDMPQEMSNDYAKLSMIDPAMTAAGLKKDKKVYKATDGGLIFNEQDPNDRYDLRENGSKELAGLPQVRSIVGGKERITIFNPDGSVRLRVNGDGTPISVYGQYVADDIGDKNVPQRMELNDVSGQKINSTNTIAKGSIPVRFDPNPKIAALQKQYAYIGADGNYYVPPQQAAEYTKRFLKTSKK